MPPGQPDLSILITAEHASNAVPGEWARCFSRHSEVLQTHRAWDPGSNELADLLASQLSAPLLKGQATRLLIDLNRSIGHPRLFSEFSRSLHQSERDRLVRSLHTPHWQAFRENIDQPGRWLHIACHSFTPVLDGNIRRTDIGLLYDPSRAPEREWCNDLAANLRTQFPALSIHANQPYRGTSNGLGQQHRRHFPPDKLMTMELEINTRLVSSPQWSDIRRRLMLSIANQLA